jgi:26S proteasome regulatory subunit T1
MEYILTEILKNSFRATVEHHRKQHNSVHAPHHPDASQATPQPQSQSQHPLPPVLITVAPPPRLPGLTTKPATLSLRIRDQGGGVEPTHMSRIFSYAFTTAGRRATGSGSSGGQHRHRRGRGRGHGYGASHHNDNDNDNDDEDAGAGGGPYAAQYIGGAAAVGSGMGATMTGGAGLGLFGEITGKGVETGLGTIAGLGFGLPMSRLYAQ